MLFDKRCSEAVKQFTGCDRSYYDFTRACAVATNNDDDVEIRCQIGGSEPFMTLSREEWEQTCNVHQRSLSRDGIYGFSKYAIYTMLYERNRLKDFFNFAQSKGYQRAYTN